MAGGRADITEYGSWSEFCCLNDFSFYNPKYKRGSDRMKDRLSVYFLILRGVVYVDALFEIVEYKK